MLLATYVLERGGCLRNKNEAVIKYRSHLTCSKKVRRIEWTTTIGATMAVMMIVQRMVLEHHHDNQEYHYHYMKDPCWKMQEITGEDHKEQGEI